MSADVKLPETVEEFQRALREAFVAGADWMYGQRQVRHHVLAGEAHAKAKERYPITRKVPRVVKFPWNWTPAKVVDLDGTEPKVKLPDGATHLAANELDALRDLLANPYKEVTE